ncbi:Poly-beta-1,6-N-acetyl-D-glucosamine N-deacetylase [Massilia sp. Bi118]|uniref:polysaccharide deacetylase family protein n=1 Tax=Massilia sp. Bi118 TaxID=2822346 RepID=UPI001D6B92F6|nr:polysaccharide deacetylase family protein [Massilia sp. Bi118]CAH0217571.1 Poly-beta-1,6-N-acetyl-D-glucosamine N-deacetylase [Massilia sp. Bi118]
MTIYVRSRHPGARLVRFAGDRLARQESEGRRLCILNYHRVLAQPDPLVGFEPHLAIFRWQMKLLADGFNVLPLSDAVDLLARGRLPARAVAITFDDGYRSVHDLALPVLREYMLPATVFVTSGFLDHGNMWNDRILEAVRRLPDGALDLGAHDAGSYQLNGLEARRHAVRQLTQTAKYLPPEGRAVLVAELERRAGGAAAPDVMLTSEMVRTMARSNIEIGAHTVSHPILTSLDDDSARREIVACKHELEAVTGAAVRLFAYPNGKEGRDFDQRHVAMAREAGYSAAFTTALGAASSGDDRFRLPRSLPWDSNPLLFSLRLLRWLVF